MIRLAGNQKEYPSGLVAHLDIPYCEVPGFDPKLTSLDIYAPGKDGSHPIVIYLHGGAWREGDKSGVDLKPKAFAEAGYLFVSANYRLYPLAKFPAHVQDLAKAIAYVHDHAPSYGGDASKIHLLGSSAGAHLVSLVATDASYLEAEGLSPCALSGVVSLDTRAYDIPALMRNLPWGGSGLYRDVFGDDRKSWARASPAKHVARGRAIPPFLLAYTGGDPNRELQAKRFARKLRRAGAKAKILAAAGKTHIGLNQDIGRKGDPVSQAVFDFLGLSTSLEPSLPAATAAMSRRSNSNLRCCRAV